MGMTPGHLAVSPKPWSTPTPGSRRSRSFRTTAGIISAIGGACATIASGSPALPETRWISCSGVRPGWQLTIDGDTAEFRYRSVTTFQIPLTTPATGRDWPQALTLVGRDATAIVILSERQCQIDGLDRTFSADVLTQDGNVAIMLTGCCEAPVE
ncbi:MAG: hypothetical protein OXL68_16935 [Paracoccaceae bacterium]|nr:hypothetical protein [Paracoccaceae bacterium]